jgi:hypothetical protein
LTAILAAVSSKLRDHGGETVVSQFDSLAKILPTGARQLTQEFSNVPWIS